MTKELREFFDFFLGDKQEKAMETFEVVVQVEKVYTIKAKSEKDAEYKAKAKFQKETGISAHSVWAEKQENDDE